MTIKPRSMLDGLEHLTRLLSLVLLPSLGAEAAASLNRPHNLSARQSVRELQHSPPLVSEPYLTVSSCPPLRMREVPAPPAYEIAPSTSGNAYVDENALPPAPPVARERMDFVPNSTSRQPSQQDQQRRRQEEETPAILPDDLRKEVRPEDVIPFFLFPKGGSAVGVSVPVPPQPSAPAQIPSSATYRQE